MSPVDAYTHTPPLHQSTMSSSSETTFTLKTCGKIDKLTQYNYLRWSSCLMDHFDSARYLDIVLGEKECPPPTSSETDQNSEAYEKWKGNDAKARAILKGACSDELRNHIEKIGTSAEMWKILEKYANSASSIKGRERLLNYFERLKPKTGESISKFLGEITSIRDQLKNTDQEISDRTFRNKILKNLPNVPQYTMKSNSRNQPHLHPKTQRRPQKPLSTQLTLTGRPAPAEEEADSEEEDHLTEDSTPAETTPAHHTPTTHLAIYVEREATVQATASREPASTAEKPPTSLTTANTLPLPRNRQGKAGAPSPHGQPKRTQLHWQILHWRQKTSIQDYD